MKLKYLKQSGVSGCAIAALALMPMAMPAAHAQDTMNGGMAGTAMTADGMATDAAMMTPIEVTGTVVRHYIDRDGNVTAIDVRTATGVQQVRFSPAVPMSQRPQDTYKLGGQTTVTGMSMNGMLMFNPDASKAMNMGMVRMDGNTTGAKPIGGLAVAGINGGDMSMAGGPNGGMAGGMAGGGMAGGGMSGMMGSTMMVMPDGKMMAVKMKKGKAMVAMSDGTMLELMKQDGKFVVPESMTGAKMMMVMSDGHQMDMDTVNGKLMVMMPDGTMMRVKADGTMKMPKSSK